MKQLVLLITFFGFGFFINAQSSLPKNVADSLWNVWSDHDKPDTVRMTTMYELIWEGYLYTRPDSANFYAQTLLNFCQEKANPKHTVRAYYLLGISYFFLGDFKPATTSFAKSLELSNDINDLTGKTAALNALGVMHSNRGEFNIALACYMESLQIAESSGGKIPFSNTLNNIASIHQNKGELAQAMGYYTRSLEAFTASGNVRGIANVYNNLGAIFLAQGDYRKALEYFTNCRDIKESLGESKGVATAMLNIGAAYEGLGQVDKAIEIYKQCFVSLEVTNYSQAIASTLHNLGMAYLRKSYFDSALVVLEQSLRYSEELEDFPGQTITLNLIGEAYRNQGQLTKAIYYDSKAFALAQKIGYFDLLRRTSRSLYKDYISLNNPDSALFNLSILRRTMSNSLEANYFTFTESQKELYFVTMEEDFSRYYDFTVFNQMTYPALADTAYNVSLQTKGLTLKSSTAMRMAIIASGDSVLVTDYDNWIELKRTVAELNSKGKDAKGLESEADALEKELVIRSNEFSSFDKIKNLDWKQVRDGLKDGEAAIEFVHFKSEIDTTNAIVYVAFVVRPDSKHPDVIKLCKEEDLKNSLGFLQGNNLTFVEKVYGKKSEAKTELYQKIWQPLEPFLKDAKTVYYSPSGLLHKVSFSAICKGQNVFLSDIYKFRQMGSTGNVAFENATEFGSLENFLLMGGVNYNSDSTQKKVWDYLPGSLAETNTINKYLQDKKFGVNYFHSNNASESVFKEKIASSSIVHIATHGFFFPDPEQVRDEMQVENNGANEDVTFRGTTNYANWSFVNNKNPLMRSGIVLANANDIWSRDPLAEGEDGILTAQEVSNLDLRNTKLVVLSACETGLGDIKGSEGVFGLQRAFKMAGVKYLIMSLWQVPDKETSEFMILFYKNLIKVKDIPTAFQKTQKVMREKYDPYYWGAFVLIE